MKRAVDSKAQFFAFCFLILLMNQSVLSYASYSSKDARKRKSLKEQAKQKKAVKKPKEGNLSKSESFYIESFELNDENIKQYGLDDFALQPTNYYTVSLGKKQSTVN